MRRDATPFVSSVIVAGIAGVAGLAVLGITWQGLAAKALVAEQVAYLVSGGIGGLAVVGFAAGFVIVQARRWAEARRRAQFHVVVQAAADLLAAARDERGTS